MHAEIFYDKTIIFFTRRLVTNYPPIIIFDKHVFTNTIILTILLVNVIFTILEHKNYGDTGTFPWRHFLSAVCLFILLFYLSLFLAGYFHHYFIPVYSTCFWLKTCIVQFMETVLFCSFLFISFRYHKYLILCIIFCNSFAISCVGYFRIFLCESEYRKSENKQTNSTYLKIV